MSDIPGDPREAFDAGVLAERERIAIWHEMQAEALDKALEQIISEGGTIDISRRSLADLHRGFAKAIRGGAL